MPTRFRPCHPDQGLLLPPDVRDWLPEGQLAHHVGDLVCLALNVKRMQGLQATRVTVMGVR